MPTRDPIPRRADAAARGIRLTVALVAGGTASEIEIEPGHCERLFRMAAYRAIRDGRLDPDRRPCARLVPGTVRERHGAVYCLDTCCVELLGPRGRVVARTEFSRAVFAAFALARAQHLHGDASADAGTLPVAYSLHAVKIAAEPDPVAMPTLPPLSVDTLTREAVACGAPAAEWIATFMAAEVMAGVVDLDALSRAAGIEVAGRIHTRVGFDREQRCFVRVLERLVISRQTCGTALSVVSPAASWADFLADAPADGPQAPASAHTHLHLQPDSAGSRSAEPEAGTLRASSDPCISISDIVTHYTVFPDPLSAALIVSLFPDRRVVTVYGYMPNALLRAEPGYWALRARPE